MDVRKLILGAVGIAVASTAVMPTASLAAEEIVYPSLVYRTGPYAPNGTPFANGVQDYIALLNAEAHILQRPEVLGAVVFVAATCQS